MRALIERLRSGKFECRGAERTFSTKLVYSAVVPAEPAQAEQECRRLLDQHPLSGRGDQRLPRLFLVHCPEHDRALDDVNPHHACTIKRLLFGVLGSRARWLIRRR